jgi:AraC-like DNA-binding protein
MKSAVWLTKPKSSTCSIEQGRFSVFRWHHHAYCEIFVPVEGRGKTTVGDYHGLVQPGQVYLVGPGLPHAFYVRETPHQPREGMRFFVLNVAMDALCQALPELSPLLTLQDQAVRGLLYKGSTAWKVGTLLEGFDVARPSIRQVNLVLGVLEILAAAPRGTYLASPQYQIKPNERFCRRVDAAAEYIHKHYTQPLRLGELARRMHVSEPTLCRLFRNAFSMTMVEYVNELRVGLACELLRTTDQPITAIALRVGYNSLSNFNRTFQRLKNATPREYRKAPM